MNWACSLLVGWLSVACRNQTKYEVFVGALQFCPDLPVAALRTFGYAGGLCSCEAHEQQLRCAMSDDAQLNDLGSDMPSLVRPLPHCRPKRASCATLDGSSSCTQSLKVASCGGLKAERTLTLTNRNPPSSSLPPYMQCTWILEFRRFTEALQAKDVCSSRGSSSTGTLFLFTPVLHWATVPPPDTLSLFLFRATCLERSAEVPSLDEMDLR